MGLEINIPVYKGVCDSIQEPFGAEFEPGQLMVLAKRDHGLGKSTGTLAAADRIRIVEDTRRIAPIRTIHHIAEAPPASSTKKRGVCLKGERGIIAGIVEAKSVG